MRLLRPLLLAIALCGFGWFQFGQPLTAKALVQLAEDAFDRRPARTVLILGNSRTYFHDMPDMVRAMADSAHDLQKLEITLDAPAGASFEILWNDARTRDLLRQRWDDVVFQPESRAQSDADLERSDGDPDGSGRAYLDAKIQSNTAALGGRTGAHLVNVGRIWGYVEHDHPDIPLTEDGNHPSLAGSYLFALALYGDLSGHDVGAVTYVPDGLDPVVAAKLRQTVRDVQSLL